MVMSLSLLARADGIFQMPFPTGWSGSWTTMSSSWARSASLSNQGSSSSYTFVANIPQRSFLEFDWDAGWEPADEVALYFNNTGVIQAYVHGGSNMGESRSIPLPAGNNVPITFTFWKLAPNGGGSNLGNLQNVRIVTDSTPPQIIGLGADATQTSVTLQVITHEPSKTRIDYGETTNLGQYVNSQTFSTNFTRTINGLYPGHDLVFQVRTLDKYGNGFITDLFATGTVPTFSSTMNSTTGNALNIWSYPATGWVLQQWLNGVWNNVPPPAPNAFSGTYPYQYWTKNVTYTPGVMTSFRVVLQGGAAAKSTRTAAARISESSETDRSLWDVFTTPVNLNSFRDVLSDTARLKKKFTAGKKLGGRTSTQIEELAENTSTLESLIPLYEKADPALYESGDSAIRELLVPKNPLSVPVRVLEDAEQ